MLGEIGLARVFPRKTSASPEDHLCFFDVPNESTPKDITRVHISTLFTYDIEKAEYLYKAWSKIAPAEMDGPAFNSFAGDEDKNWRRFQREWTRPAITRSEIKKYFCGGGEIMNDKNLKEVLADEILKLIADFENVTGAEIKTIRLERFETSEMQDKIKKTSPYKILFETR